jgi:hypothetical protein
MARLYAATGDGIVRLDEAGEAWTVELALSGSGAQCLAVDPADPDTVYAGLREGGVRRSVDGGRSWVDCGLPEPGVFSLAVSAADGAVYAGTEPSRLFRSEDRGESWRELEALLELPSRPSWSFPPRPWTSHVRWIAPSPHDSELILVGIELGGLMRSTDGGQSWQDHRPGAQPDVHSLAWHPHTPGRAYEAGGGGTAFEHRRGRDLAAGRRGPRSPLRVVGHGRSLTTPTGGTSRRAPARSPAHGRRDPQAHIYRRRDGEPWQSLAGGLPEPLPAMPYALLATDGRLFAGLADGQLWESRDRGDTWAPLQLEGDSVAAVLALAAADRERTV